MVRLFIYLNTNGCKRFLLWLYLGSAIYIKRAQQVVCVPTVYNMG